MGAPIVTYWAGPCPVTEADAKQLADGNWNLAWVTRRGLPEGGNLPDYFISQLDLLQRHGLRGLLSIPYGAPRDPKGICALDDPDQKKRLDAIVEAVKKHPAMYAYCLNDEPSAAIFYNQSRMKAYFETNDPSHLVFINLLPVTASNKQLGTAGDSISAYTNYLSEFVRVLKPRVLCYDHYHFGVRGDGLKYFLNLKLIRQAAIDAGIPFMNFVQACSWTKNSRIPTGEELRWLAYTSLAYGSGGIGYYVYGHPKHDGGMMYTASSEEMFGKTGVILGGPPTPLYYYARELNREFAATAAQLQSLRSLGVYHVGILPEGASPLPDAAPFKLDPPVPQKELPPSPVKKPSADEGTILNDEGIANGSRLEGFVIGYFGKGASPTHALVVNLDYRTYGGIGQPRQKEFTHPVRRTLVGPGRLEFFDSTTSKWMDAGGNSTELRLPPGGGILVRVSP